MGAFGRAWRRGTVARDRTATATVITTTRVGRLSEIKLRLLLLFFIELELAYLLGFNRLRGR